MDSIKRMKSFTKYRPSIMFYFNGYTLLQAEFNLLEYEKNIFPRLFILKTKYHSNESIFDQDTS